jgi:hypothetical protein
MDLILQETNPRQTAIHFVKEMFQDRKYHHISECFIDTEQDMNLGPHLSYIHAKSDPNHKILAVFTQVCHDPNQALNMNMDENESYEQSCMIQKKKKKQKQKKQSNSYDDDDDEEPDNDEEDDEEEENDEEDDDDDEEEKKESDTYYNHRASDCESTWASRLTETKKQMKDAKTSNIKFVQHLLKYLHQHHFTILVLITDGITIKAQSMLQQTQNIQITIFKYSETMINPKRHNLQPQNIRKLSDQDKKIYIEKHPRYQKELIKRSTKDALMKYMGFVHGDIIQCEVSDKQAGWLQETYLIDANINHVKKKDKKK